jgi:predicted metal-binding membrane protein
MDPEVIEAIRLVGPIAATIVGISVGGWVLTTWMRIKNGYPLDGAWGQKLYPKNDQETVERVRLLSQENAQLRAELGSIKDRLVSVEKIVVDDTHRLTAEIEALRGPTN